MPHIANNEPCWHIKKIAFSPSGDPEGRNYRIIIPPNNEPCPFITICNILILRGQIKIPEEAQTISYESLSQCVLKQIKTPTTTGKDKPDMSAELMSSSTTRMSFSPVFTSKELEFRPIAGELKLFANLGIRLVHGWFVPSPDPDTNHEEYAAIVHVNDYQSAQDLIDEKHSHGPPMGANSSHARSPSLNEMEKFQISALIDRFLERTSSQLTSYGRKRLLDLKSSSSEPTSSSPSSHTTTEHILPPKPELFALFRKSHLAVLYRHGHELFTLVTDHQYLNMPEVVWQRLPDKDQDPPEYFNKAFKRYHLPVDEFNLHFRVGDDHHRDGHGIHGIHLPHFHLLHGGHRDR